MRAFHLQSSMAPPGIFSIFTYFLMSISRCPVLASAMTVVTASNASSYMSIRQPRVPLDPEPRDCFGRELERVNLGDRLYTAQQAMHI